MQAIEAPEALKAAERAANSSTSAIGRGRSCAEGAGAGEGLRSEVIAPSPDAFGVHLSPEGRGGIKSIASIPPASKKLLAKVARAVKSAAVPRLARKTFGRAPFVFRISSERSRNRSNPSASRIGGSGSNLNLASPYGARWIGLASRTATWASARFGNSLAPVRASLRRAILACR